MQQGLIYLPSASAASAAAAAAAVKATSYQKAKSRSGSLIPGKRRVGFLSEMVSKLHSFFLKFPLAISLSSVSPLTHLHSAPKPLVSGLSPAASLLCTLRPNTCL